MSTETAQRRLLEALSNMHEGPAGVSLSAFSYGVREMAVAMQEMPQVVDLYLAIADLADAVRSDLTSKETTHG